MKLTQLEAACLIALSTRGGISQLVRALQKHKAEKVTELYQAARDFTKSGRHSGDCEFEHLYGPCVKHLETCNTRRARLKQALSSANITCPEAGVCAGGKTWARIYLPNAPSDAGIGTGVGLCC